MRPANKIWVTALVAALAAALVVGMVASADPGDTIRISVASDGTEANMGSEVHPIPASVSADGRYVAFESPATNLVTEDNNNAIDVFVHDTESRETTRVSINSDGVEANNNSYEPTISGDGRFVAFWSSATNLVPDDTNDDWDVFVHDTETGDTISVSVNSRGDQADMGSFMPAISDTGRYIAFSSNATNLVPGDTNNTFDIFVHDTETGDTTRVSVNSDGVDGNSGSYGPGISADGRYVSFESHATNLVPGDTTGDESDVFLHDIESGETSRLSVHSDGTPAIGHSFASVISADGRYVAFQSDAPNLVDGDTNNVSDVFVRDTVTGRTTRVSVHSNGAQGDRGSVGASISADGRYVAFDSASNLVDGDTFGIDVFVHDTESGSTTRISINSSGTPGNNASLRPALSADGRHVAFTSFATNLVPNDTNDIHDVFLHEIDNTPPPPPTTTTTMPPGGEDYFIDDDGHLFEDDINAIAEAGITRGCNPPDNDRYCPDESFLRGQAAAFLRRALDVPASDTDHFSDDDNSVFEEDINAIATEGITRGCNPPDNTLFCPEDPFTRGQAAAFVRRALDVPATDTDHFTDDNDSVFEEDINAIAEAGITRGCNPPDNDRYCPDELLTRGQAAAFMRRALLP
ncbi:MAG: hypothetical protein GEU79_11210 [Acidimicrobiia bacterium]|nr:hypothetical protein [Acidimicrobiia bacterium]